MKINIWFGWQLGLLISIGVNFEKRKYICIDIPFCTIQILWFKSKKQNNENRNSKKEIDTKSN